MKLKKKKEYYGTDSKNTRFVKLNFGKVLFFFFQEKCDFVSEFDKEKEKENN